MVETSGSPPGKYSLLNTMPATTPYKKKSYRSLVAPITLAITTFRSSLAFFGLLGLLSIISSLQSISIMCFFLMLGLSPSHWERGRLPAANILLAGIGMDGSGRLRQAHGVRQNHVGGLFGDHDGGRIRVARDDFRHDRRVDHAQLLHAVHAQALIDDGHGVMPHLAGAAGV